MLPQKTINGITLNIRHTMLPVSDMERTVDFYTRLLGMDVQRIRDVPARNERVRYLGYGNEDEGPSLELIESTESSRKSALGALDGPHRALRVGLLQAQRKAQSRRSRICQRPRHRTGPAARTSTLSSKTRTVTSSN